MTTIRHRYYFKKLTGLLATRMFSVAASLAVIVGCSAPAAAEGTEPSSTAIVSTDRGLVQGRVANGQAQFLGIPYAAPPVGPRRWMPPEVAPSWSQPLQARTFAKSCPQGFGPMNSRHDEDCLFLNVYAPGSEIDPKAKLPVMVWFPGGGLVAGESNDYDGSMLARKGVIVVTLNYRLGVLGFFAQPNLDREGHDFADYGLLDQQFALRWVRNNIAQFGGDPANVTIFGESAGGGSVFSQMASPGAAGLFQKAIVQSGSYIAIQSSDQTPSLGQAETIGRYFSIAVGCPDLSAACLRKVPVQKILDLQQDYRAGYIVDGRVLPMRFSEAFKSGKFAHVPVLNGSNMDEWRWAIAFFAEIPTGKPLPPEFYPLALSWSFSPSAVLNQTLTVGPDRVLAEYPLARYNSPSEALGAAQTDGFMACPALKMDEWLSQFVPTYGYEFTYRDAPIYLPKVSFPYGAAHTIELQFLFPGFRWGPESASHALNENEAMLSDRMVNYWTNFARTGAPVPNGEKQWPKFGKDSRQLMNLDIGSPKLDDTFTKRHNCNFWNSVSVY
jgi:para-nitrobenzyl esterase